MYLRRLSCLVCFLWAVRFQRLVRRMGSHRCLHPLTLVAIQRPSQRLVQRTRSHRCLHPTTLVAIQCPSNKKN